MKTSVIKQYLPFFLKLTFLGVIGAFFLDFVKYDGFFQNNLGVAPIYFAFAIAIIHLLIRRRSGITLDDTLSFSLLMIVFPVSVFLYVSIYMMEEYGFLFPNYYFSNFAFQYSVLKLFSVTVGLFGLIHASSEYFSRYWRLLWFYFVAFSLLALSIFYIQEPELFLPYIREDGMVENVTFVMYFAAGVASFLIAHKIRKWKLPRWHKRFLEITFLLAGIGFLVIAGEEISWGQRILKIETPESIVSSNRQGEINFHNSEAFWPFVYTGYAIVGLYGSFLWLVRWLFADWYKHILRRLPWLELFIVDGYLFINFFMIVLYTWLRKSHGPWKYQGWEELSELVLIIGVLVHLLQSYRYIKKQQLVAKVN